MQRDLCVVTGGAGFIGSSLVKELLRHNYRVTVIDNFSTGRKRNLSGTLENIQLIEADITDRKALQRSFKNASYIFHLAAMTSVPESVKDPLTCQKVNGDGTLMILSAARACGVKRVIFASTSAIYGDAQGEICTEDLIPAPISPYGISKLTGELYCHHFTRTHGLETVTLRYFNVFGPYQNPNSDYAAVVPKFITSMLTETAPIIYGDGEQVRDFTFVEDVVRANILAATTPQANGQIMNIASGQSISLNELVNLINKQLSKNIKPIYSPARKGDIKHSRASIERARKILGYHPSPSFEASLDTTLDWYATSEK